MPVSRMRCALRRRISSTSASSRARVSRLVRAFDSTRTRRETSVCERRSAVSACRSLAFLSSSVSTSPSAIGGNMSFTSRLPRRISSPKPSSFSAAIGDFRISASAAFSPASMRLAISTSPSRVSSETAPISRRYTRTGSFERKPSTSSGPDGRRRVSGLRIMTGACH